MRGILCFSILPVASPKEVVSMEIYQFKTFWKYSRFNHSLWLYWLELKKGCCMGGWVGGWVYRVYTGVGYVITYVGCVGCGVWVWGVWWRGVGYTCIGEMCRECGRDGVISCVCRMRLIRACDAIAECVTCEDTIWPEYLFLFSLWILFLF